MEQKLCAYLLLFPAGSAPKPEGPVNTSDLQSVQCRCSAWWLSDLLALNLVFNSVGGAWCQTLQDKVGLCVQVRWYN